MLISANPNGDQVLSSWQRSVEAAVMETHLQATQGLLPAAAHQRGGLGRAEEAVPVKLDENLLIPLGQSDRGNLRRPMEAGESF